MKFDYLSWEAFATILTGILAVGAATYVGIRQGKISDRQTQLIEKQVNLESAKLRAELFDRRIALYDAATAFLAEILRTGKDPTGEILQRYLVAIDHARFLFNSQVSEELERIRKRSVELWFLNEQLHGEDRLAVGPERSKAARDRAQCLQDLIGEFEKLPRVLEAHLAIEPS